MGFYENAFRLMRECYAELDRDPRTLPDRHLARRLLAGTATSASPSRDRDGRWMSWAADLPPIEGLPGEAPAASRAGR